MAGGKEGKNKEVPARAAKAVVEKSSSLWGISQCWRGVVQQQVELGGPSVGAREGTRDPAPGGCRGERGLAVPWEHGEGAGLYLASMGPGGLWGRPCCACHPGRAQVSA